MRLKDKVAIVTGAGQGIGKAYARRYLQEGARVAIAEVSEDTGRVAAEELATLGEVFFVQTDISDEASAADCAQAVKDRFGSIDILLNNAAVYHHIDYNNWTYEYLLKIFSINLHGAWLMIKAVAPAMAAQRFGRIINQGSDAAYMYVPEQFESPEFKGVSSFSYNQTKWGIHGLTKFMAVQLGQYGITVNCISAGPTMTEAQALRRPERLEELRRQTCLKRLLQPEDLTGAAVFFASEDADVVTGQVLCVDAGLRMPG
jgi:3-oxoacyl-[acyl-carrier protein] reductase